MDLHALASSGVHLEKGGGTKVDGSLALTPYAVFTSSKGGRMTLFAPHPLK